LLITNWQPGLARDFYWQLCLSISFCLSRYVSILNCFFQFFAKRVEKTV
jgi:hypothetical protein